MSHGTESQTAAEIVSQPDCWRRAARLAQDVRDALPAAGERVAVTGCGTSWFVAQSYAALREASGAGESDAWSASEFPARRRYDRVVAISRSGTTSEVLSLLAALPSGTPLTVLTADPEAPLARSGQQPVVLDFADERSVVQTRFATSALALLRASLGEDLAPAIADAGRAVSEALPADALAASQLTFLGSGWTWGIAQEAALKLREAAVSWTEAYPAMEYRHGPIAVAGPGRVVWAFGAVPQGLAADIAATGGQLISGSDPTRLDGSGALDPMADLVRAQRLAVARAEAADLDPDRPRHLTRSVVLDETAG